MFDKNWKINVTFKDRYETTGIKDFVINHLQQRDIGNPIIIDVGCSYGIAFERVFSILRTLGFHPYTIGIDASKKVRKKAEKIFDEFISEDVLNVCGKENVADIVICSKAAIFVTGTRRTAIIKKCTSFLKEDGIMITDVDCYPPRTLRTNIVRVMRLAWFQIPTLYCFKQAIRKNFYREYNKRRDTTIREDVFKLTKEESIAYTEKILQGWNNRSAKWKMWWKFKIYRF